MDLVAVRLQTLEVDRTKLVRKAQLAAEQAGQGEAGFSEDTCVHLFARPLPCNI